MAIGLVTSTQASICAMKKNNDDFYALGAGVNTTSTTFVDAGTLTFTPSTTNDYLIMAYTSYRVDDAARSATLQLLDNNTATAYVNKTLYNRTTTEDAPWMTFIKLSSLSGSQTFKVQAKTETLNTVRVGAVSILALNLSAFPNNYYAESLTGSTTSSATFQDKVTLSPTLNIGRAHMIFGTAFYRRQINLGGRFAEVQTIYDSTIQSFSKYAPTNGADFTPHHSMRRIYPTANPTIKIQYRSTDGSANAGITDAALCMIELNDNQSVNLNGPAQVNGNTRFC